MHRFVRFIRTASVMAFALSALGLLIVLRIVDPLPVEALRLRMFDLYQLAMPRPGSYQPVVSLSPMLTVTTISTRRALPRSANGRGRAR